MIQFLRTPRLLSLGRISRDYANHACGAAATLRLMLDHSRFSNSNHAGPISRIRGAAPDAECHPRELAGAGGRVLPRTARRTHPSDTCRCAARRHLPSQERAGRARWFARCAFDQLREGRKLAHASIEMMISPWLTIFYSTAASSGS